MKSLNKREKGMFRLGIVTFFLGMVVMAAILSMYLYVFHGGRVISEKTYDYYTGIDKDFGKYYSMEAIIDENSLYPIDEDKYDQTLSNSIISLTGDKYAEYYTSEEYTKIEKKYLEPYTGIGIAVSNKEGDFTITKVLTGSPAADEGLKSGDIITKVDGKTPKSTDTLSEMLTGKAGEAVELTVKRNNDKKSYTLYRAEVENKTVTYKILDEDNKIGYIKISSFANGTSDDFEKALKYFSDMQYERIVIDLRDNSGGIMKEGIDVADQLLPACKIITLKDNDNDSKVYNSDDHQTKLKYDLLVNGETASAAEIVACAVKENGGGKVIGSTTFGKGLVQGTYELDDGSVLKITVKEYFSPKGNKINGIGVEPDTFAGDDEMLDKGIETLLTD